MNELLTMLDTKYKRLEYIQSTGTQYINTNYSKIENHSYRLKGVVNFQDVTTRQLIGSQNFVFFGVVDGYVQVAQSGTTHTDIQVSIDEDIDFDITFDLQNQTVNYIINGVSGSLSTSMLTGGNFYLFNIGNNQFSCKCKLKSFLLYDNDVLVRKYVPTMIKSNNEIGMLDLVEGKFYGNAGTGKFTANLDTMYALIQGSPTVQDGRVSGFSSSNYLKTALLPQTINKLDLHIHCLTSSVSSSIQGIFSFSRESSNNNPTLELQYSKFRIWNGSTAIANQGEAIEANVPFEAELHYDGSNIQYLVKQNNVEKLNYIISNATFNGNLPLTLGKIWSAFSNGTLDLNRSYIKIDDTKYKLQAVVGYTKVGTLTENPTGVFSGFSSNDYLTLPSLDCDENIEIHLKMNSGTITSGSLYNLLNFIGTAGTIALDPRLIFLLQYYDTQNTLKAVKARLASYTIQSNTDYYMIAKKINTKISVSISTDNQTWSTVETNLPTDISYFRKNTGLAIVNNSVFTGSIDLKETYIKINNKLWFNGLEA